MMTEISKEAVQKVHERIFGNAFCALEETRAECSPPGFPSLRTRLPFPEFTIKQCPPYTLVFNRAHCNSQPGFSFEIDQVNRVAVKFNSADFSLGVIPGDVVLSLNDVDFQQQSLHDMNSKLSPSGPPEIKLVVTPSEESIEWSVRSVDMNPSYLSELQQMFSTSNWHHFDSLLKKQDEMLQRVNLRLWIKQTGSFNLLNALIKQLYLRVLRNSTSDYKGLYNVNDLVLVSHRDGYSLGSITEKRPDDTYQIHLSPGNQQLRVSLDDISRANTKELEGIEDLMLLQHLNEPALVYNLHARFLASLPYTYAGDFALIAFNPMRNLDIYNEFVKQLFVKCENRLDMPPHIYSVAQTALANLKGAFASRGDIGGADECFEATGDERTYSITTNGVSDASTAPVKVPTQAICVLGRSGSGKSINTEYLVEYFFPQCAQDPEIDAPKVRAVMCLLDAFTCSRTLLNSNASRCLRLFTIEFTAENRSDLSVQLNPSGLLIDILLLDKFRVARRPMGEPTFHIFYYFLAGLEDKARREYMLEDLSSPNLFMTPLQSSDDQSLAKSRWQAVNQAARVLGPGFTEVFNNSVCRLLAAIYHLGCAGATTPQAQAPAARCFVNLVAAERAAHLLGLASVDTLTTEVFGDGESARAPSVSSGQSIQVMDSLMSDSASNLDLLGGFVANLYAIATTTLRDHINKALNSSPSVRHSTSDVDWPSRSARIFVVDPPGLQTPEAGGRMSGGSFEDLLYNYTNECLLQLYRDSQSQADDSGNISCSDLGFVAFLDNPPNNPCSSQRQSLSTPRPMPLRANDSPRHSCNTPLSQSDDDFTTTWNTNGRSPVSDATNTGLLWLLDYACSTGDMKTFIQLVAQKYVNHKQVHASRNSRLMRRLHRSGAFSLNHWNATSVVQYHPSTWLSSCHYLNSPRKPIELLQRSRLSALRGVGDSMDESASVSALSVSSSTGIVESFIFDTKYVIDLLRTASLGASSRNFALTRANILWVHCVLPVASAGLWQVAPTPIFTAAATPEVSGLSAHIRLRNPRARFCVPFVRAQLHAISLATDLIYLKSAFTSRLQDAPFANNRVVASPRCSLSEDITVTEPSGPNNVNSKSSRKIEEALVDSSSPSVKEENLNSNSSQQPISVASTTLHSDVDINHTTNESSDAYNFVFNSTTNNLPWEQLLTLMPVDRGLIKQLRFQLEELEESKEALLRRQRVLSADLEECQQQLYKELREKRTAELRCQTALRQNGDLQCRVEELEEELEEATRKQRRSALANSASPGFNPYANEVSQLIEERSAMREEIADLQERIAAATTEKSGAVDMELVCLKAKVHELEGRLELETSTKLRLQSTVDRLKTQLEHVAAERDKLLEAVQEERQNSRHLSRSLREAREDKERAERRLADEEHRRCETSNEVSSCVQEQFRLQQELSHLLLRCKQEGFRSVVLPRNGGVEDDGENGTSDDEQTVDRFINHLSGAREVTDVSQSHADDNNDLNSGLDFL